MYAAAEGGFENSKMITRNIIAFCHIWKAGGTTIEYLLRKNFGWRHINPEARREPIMFYVGDEVTADLRKFPFLRSFGGMHVKPFIEYGQYDAFLLWFTLVRDPIKRYISQCVHDIERFHYAEDFYSWSKNVDRKNMQVRAFAGEDDLQAAKQIAENRFRFIGITERYHESILMMRERLGLRDFEVSYPKPMNVTQSKGMREEVASRLDKYMPIIKENNELDIKLYNFISKQLWPQQVEEYGKERLARDIRRTNFSRQPSLAARVRWCESFVFQNVFYRPFVKIQRIANNGLGPKEVVKKKL